MALALRALTPSARVLLLDAARFPRVKPCGGAISRRGLRVLLALGAPAGGDGMTLRSAELRDGRASRTVAPEIDDPLGIVVSRVDFDDTLLSAARARGVEVREGTRVRAIGPWLADDLPAGGGATGRAGSGRRLETTAGPVDARVVVGADGATSVAATQVRRERGGPRPRLATAIERITGGGSDDPPRDRMRYDFDVGAGRDRCLGYAWDFPCPHSRTDAQGSPARRPQVGAVAFNRGVYSIVPRSLPLPTPAIAERLRRRRGDPPALDRARAWPELLYDERRPIAAPGLFLAGEAIGVHPLTGEGIAPALESALVVAPWIAAALREPPGPFADAAFRFRRTMLGRRLALGSRLAALLYGPRGGLWREAALGDARLRELLLLDFAGDLDLPARKAELVTRFARHVTVTGLRRLFGA